MVSRTRWTGLGITLVALALAVILTMQDIRLASSQTVILTAKRVEEAVPLDEPFADIWEKASTVEVPLSGQNIVPPKVGGEKTVKAHALHDGQQIYILVEWKDSSEDTALSRQAEFTDAVALQFPVAESEQVPAFCMGNPDAPVNIWQWKAAWQADMEEGFVDVEDAYPNMFVDLYPFEDEEIFYPARALGNVFAETARTTAADNLLAGSFGTLVQADDQLVQGTGEWRDSRWRVVFARDLTVDGDYTQFAVDKSTNVALAVWDGAADERNGQKVVSQFLRLDVSTEIAKAGGGGLPIWAIVLIVLGGVALVAAVGAGYATQRKRA